MIKKLGICVKTDEHEGLVYSIILNSEIGENVICGQKISPGKWVLFTPTDENIFIECQYKRLADSENFQITQARRPVSPIEQTIQVKAVIDCFEYIYNDQFYICKDELLGQVLVGKNDPFINESFEYGDKVEMAVAYLENYLTNIHWVAIAVNSKTDEGNTNYRIIKGLPGLLRDFSNICYEK
uniref:Uncharacterized protein n=1 Tax=Meloidogyne enterolobii TaxID=390850 RepID=A0A6V7U306_MELEN|nr:unnamed protein product [Meloidogyne enterolobii]